MRRLRLPRAGHLPPRADAGGTENVDTAQLPELVGDRDEVDLYERLLSAEVFERMLTDRVSWQKIKRAALTVIVWVMADKATAEQMWETGPAQGEAPAPNRAARRAVSRSAGASTTRSAASTSGTSSGALFWREVLSWENAGRGRCGVVPSTGAVHPRGRRADAPQGSRAAGHDSRRWMCAVTASTSTTARVTRLTACSSHTGGARCCAVPLPPG